MLERLEDGMGFHILPVPDEIAAAWKQAKVRRLVGTINGVSANRALMNHADGGSFLIVGRDLIKAAGVSARAPAKLAFQPDPAPQRLELPQEFALVLAQDAAARTRWESFTPGRKRSMLSFLSSAKTETTRIKRAIELARKIRTHTLYGDNRSVNPAPPPRGSLPPA